MGPIDYIKHRQLPSGRSIYALKRVEAAAGEQTAPAVAQRAAATLAHALRTRRAELRFRNAKKAAQYGPLAPQIDAELDGAVGVLFDAIRLYVRADGAVDEAKVAAARTLANELFPRGLQPITGTSYIEQHESLALILQRLGNADDLLPASQLIGLVPFANRVATLNEAFAGQLATPPAPDTPTWDEVLALRAGLHAEVCRLVAVVLGTYPDETSEDIAARQALLGPLHEQEEALVRAYRRRRGTSDVDPDTGIEVNEEGQTPDAPLE